MLKTGLLLLTLSVMVCDYEVTMITINAKELLYTNELPWQMEVFLPWPSSSLLGIASLSSQIQVAKPL